MFDLWSTWFMSPVVHPAGLDSWDPRVALHRRNISDPNQFQGACAPTPRPEAECRNLSAEEIRPSLPEAGCVSDLGDSRTALQTCHTPRVRANPPSSRRIRHFRSA